MKLAEFIRANMQDLLEGWDRFALTIRSADSLNATGRRDHAREMLEVIASQLDKAGVQAAAPKLLGAADKSATEHGLDRLDADFSVNEIISEYRALRANILQLWLAGSQQPYSTTQLEDMMFFNLAMDQALDAALASYSQEKEMGTRLLRTILNASADQTFVLDTEGRFQYVNQATADLFDKPRSFIIGKTCFDLGFDFAALMQRSLKQVIEAGESYRGELSFTHGAGQQFEYILSPVLFDEKGPSESVEAVVGIARDITLRKAAEDQSWHHANFDMLTGLPNRRLFLDRLQQDLRYAERAKTPLAVMFIDLDDFKNVNDSMGHDSGDQLLRLAAQRLNSCVRESDTVARMGGDEFTVTLSTISSKNHVMSVAKKIIDELSRPFSLDGNNLCISASVGVAVYPTDATEPKLLIKAADLAMFQAKQAGRNRVRRAVAPELSLANGRKNPPKMPASGAPERFDRH
ncbi:MAG: diguanylate cyclase domain-containing protein [Pseudomonas sp.]